ncbi:MAG: UDP-glucose:undecaprenyl-phosphate glucose-phosphate transferase [Bacteroidota bacterium]|jgi:exopolysaccharide biosynthesis polyprenyl glycosylphosphotransferase
MKQRHLLSVLIFIDWLTATLAWTLFFYFRKTIIEKKDFVTSDTFYLGAIFIPIAWLLLYYFQGTYHEIKRHYRFKLLNLTFFGSIIGSIIIFFTLLLDDQIDGYKIYYNLIVLIFTLHFLFTIIPRMIFITILVKRIHSGKFRFKTLLIGGSEKAVDIFNELNDLPKGIHDFVGFVNINGVDKLLENQLTYLGHANDLSAILRNLEIEEVIIALESMEHNKLKAIVGKLEGSSIRIRILPDLYDILSGHVKMTNIFSPLLIEVNTETMPIWQQSVKRFLDVMISIVSIILLIPLYLLMAIAVKLSSKGPIFFLQERIGLNGKPFQIIKFRTMFIDAEKLGPQLSSSNDPRITPIGRFMRKLRLDEFPQFMNVLLGDMSLVGPRPERQFYIDKISEIEPQYLHLTKVRPGITSWGQVKFGYAENVEQMLERMKFDLLYLKNRTLALDFKIMLYTILIVLKAKGK